MAFGRGKSADNEDKDDGDAVTGPESTAADVDDGDLDGPFDIEDFDDPEVAAVGRLDLGSVLIPLPEAGQVQVAEAQQQQALFTYQSTIQGAFRDVNDALIDQEKTRVQLAAQRQQVESLQLYAELAHLRYDNGYTSYLEVVDAERSLFNVQLSYTKTQQVLLQAAINLYKAMGGGWTAEAAKLSEPPVKN